MNRRSFFKHLSVVVGAIMLPTTVLSYDPVKQEVVKPKLDNSPLLGYKSDTFWEAGVVYAPYIPLYQTCDLIKKYPYDARKIS
jgi:hypothetical protein